MRSLSVLLLLVLVAGCTSLGAGDEADRASTCATSDEVLLSWNSEDSENPEEQKVVVLPGATELTAAWTDPTASARGYAVVLRDPAGDEVFVRRYDDGATAGSTTASVGVMERIDRIASPPRPGTYVFSYSTPGEVAGARLELTVTGCW